MPQDWHLLLASYWSGARLDINLLVFLNLAGALALGALVGYERSFRGRAAGMRTYGLVCMASAALTVMTGYPGAWYGGFDGTAALHAGDPTRVIQGIVTGIGFLGAGVIMKDGLTISGLTTAASIWAASAIGVLLGVGFYAAAILLALLCAGTMMWGAKVEAWLPSHHALGVTVQLSPGAALDAAALDAFLRGLGYQLAPGSLSLRCEAGLTEWRFVAVIRRRSEAAPLDALAQALGRQAWVAGYTLAPARN